MLGNTIRKVYVCLHRIDYRKRLSGMLAEAFFLELDPYKGDCLVFMHPSRRQIRVLCGDEFGSWILERFFEGGRCEQRFEFMPSPCFYEISVAELGMILGGKAFVIEKSTKKWI